MGAYEHHVPQEARRDDKKSALPESTRAHRFPTYANIIEDNTLRSNLRKMAEIDAERIFMVRKINKLGLGSAQLLKTHFSQFGVVENVSLPTALTGVKDLKVV